MLVTFLLLEQNNQHLQSKEREVSAFVFQSLVTGSKAGSNLDDGSDGEKELTLWYPWNIEQSQGAEDGYIYTILIIPLGIHIQPTYQ